jgi:hypothetical protein
MTWFRRGAASLYNSGSLESHSSNEGSPYRGPASLRDLDFFSYPPHPPFAPKFA